MFRFQSISYQNIKRKIISSILKWICSKNVAKLTILKFTKFFLIMLTKIIFVFSFRSVTPTWLLRKIFSFVFLSLVLRSWLFEWYKVDGSVVRTHIWIVLKLILDHWTFLDESHGAILIKSMTFIVNLGHKRIFVMNWVTTVRIFLAIVCLDG